MSLVLKDFVNAPVAIGLLIASLASASYLENKKLRSTLERQSALISQMQDEMHEADFQVGRAQTKFFENLEALQLQQQGISSDILRQIQSIDAGQVAVSKLVAEHQTNGRATLIREVVHEPAPAVGSACPVPASKPAENIPKGKKAAIRFKDWRLTATIMDDNLDYTLNQQFEVVLVEARSKDGKVHPSYAELYELDLEGKRLQPKLTLKSFVVERANADLSGFNLKIMPHLALGIDHKLRPTGMVSASLFSYQSPSGSDIYRLLGVGIGYSNGFKVLVQPAMAKIPLLNDLWGSIFFGRSLLEDDYSAGVGVGTSF